MFGYDLKTLADGRTMQLAKPEKALLDLLYLYPFYNTATEIKELRLDEDYMQDEFNWELLQDYTKRFNNKTLERKVKLVTNIFSS